MEGMAERRRVGGWLQVVRVATGLSQGEAAQAARLARSTLAGAERGHQRLSSEAWRRLSFTYGRPEWELAIVTDWRVMAPFTWTPAALADHTFSARAHAAVAARLADHLTAWEPEHLMPRWAVAYLGVLRIVGRVGQSGPPAAEWGPVVEQWSTRASGDPAAAPEDEDVEFGKWLAALDPGLLSVRHDVRVGRWVGSDGAPLPPPLGPFDVGSGTLPGCDHESWPQGIAFIRRVGAGLTPRQRDWLLDRMQGLLPVPDLSIDDEPDWEPADPALDQGPKTGPSGAEGR